MRYPRDITDLVNSQIKQRRIDSWMDTEHRRKEVMSQYPHIADLQKDLLKRQSNLGCKLFLAEITQEKFNDSLSVYKKAFKDALKDAGFTENYLDEKYCCSACEDTGYVDGKSCHCRIELLNQHSFKFLSNLPETKCTFDCFSLEYYEDDNRKYMQKLTKSCKNYVDTFCSESSNLLFLGKTGLGKTHLSVSIATEVVFKGYMVLYASAPDLFTKLGDALFTNSTDTNADKLECYRELAYNADLIVIDDLGTEFKTKVTDSEMYNLINSRLNKKLPTIINTNLSLEELDSAYGDRVTSRIIGSYAVNKFSGTDIRYQKRVANNK